MCSERSIILFKFNSTVFLKQRKKVSWLMSMRMNSIGGNIGVYLRCWARVNNLINVPWTVYFKNPSMEELILFLSMCPRYVFMCASVRVCACAPWWQPLDRSKAAMMNRHLAQGSALAQWAVNLPLPLSACRMLNKVIWIFVILMCQNAKVHWSLTVRENVKRFILPCRPIGLLW